MNGPLRKGWCPGALRPMQARDGLLVRLRITGGIVPAAKAHALAGLAARHGNGAFDLSTRANLQMRGVTEHTLFPLQNALRDLGLIDEDVGAESVRNVISSPLAGLHDGLDIVPLVAALEACLAGTESLHALPGKFGFLVDDGSSPSLAGVTADVRFDWDDTSGHFAVGLGGSAAHALRIGQCRPEDLVARAVRVAEGALTLFARSRSARRMRMLIHEFGANWVAPICGGAPPNDDRQAIADPTPDIVTGACEFAGRPVFGLTAPFGRLDSAMLEAAARLAADTRRGEIRLTPWRALLVPDAMPTKAETTILRTAGFIVAARDPRLGIAACTGREGCTSGTTSTHADADALADLVARLGQDLHVSGCQKGCAKAGVSAITLVGRDGRYELVRDGRASDFPVRRGLDLPGVRAAIEAILDKA